MATIFNMHAAKTDFSDIVRRVEAGEEILLARNGEPVARITRVTKRKRKLPWDALKGQLHMTADFDAPLGEFKNYL